MSFVKLNNAKVCSNNHKLVNSAVMAWIKKETYNRVYNECEYE